MERKIQIIIIIAVVEMKINYCDYLFIYFFYEWVSSRMSFAIHFVWFIFMVTNSNLINGKIMQITGAFSIFHSKHCSPFSISENE